MDYHNDFVPGIRELGVGEVPTYEEFWDFIIPVYNYHPILNVPNAKQKTYELYAQFGLGIFKALKPESDEFEAMEDSLRSMREAYEEAKREFDNLNMEYIQKCREVRKEWRCA